MLGRLEYDRGNYEGALQVLEGIQGHTFGASLRFFITDSKIRQKKRRQLKNGTDDRALGTFLHGASLLVEALYLRAKCYQELGRLSGVYFFPQKHCNANLIYVSLLLGVSHAYVHCEGSYTLKDGILQMLFVSASLCLIRWRLPLLQGYLMNGGGQGLLTCSLTL